MQVLSYTRFTLLPLNFVPFFSSFLFFFRLFTSTQFSALIVPSRGIINRARTLRFSRIFQRYCTPLNEKKKKKKKFFCFINFRRRKRRTIKARKNVGRSSIYTLLCLKTLANNYILSPRCQRTQTIILVVEERSWFINRNIRRATGLPFRLFIKTLTSISSR
mgnify:CR=1 FL=1